MINDRLVIYVFNCFFFDVFFKHIVLIGGEDFIGLSEDTLNNMTER
jgi:hypothetical protein